MSNHVRRRLDTIGRVLAVICAAFALDVLSGATAQAGLRPVTAFCFKTLGNEKVCTCATDRLAKLVSDSSMQQYESLIALALGQAGVPRAKAWRTALSQQAQFSGSSVSQVRLDTEATGREHTLAVRKCQAKAAPAQ